MSSGYLYRIPQADAALLQRVIAELVTPNGWTFGGAALWDFDIRLGPANLRPLQPFTAGAAVSLAGDVGHAFNRAAEVRWKRRDDGAYDVLVLSETEQTLAEAQLLGCWSTTASPTYLRQTDNAPDIAVYTYYAPNGTAQLLRYVGVGYDEP
jgi:hypothetical protein